MHKKSLFTAAALLMPLTASYAASPTVAVGGQFSLSYTPSSGDATNMNFSSTPGDGAVPGLLSDLGANTMSGQSVTNNPFFLDNTVHGQEVALSPLTVGTPETVNFFTASPVGSSCAHTQIACTNNTAAGTINATFTFTEPSGATGTFTDTALYQADYNTTSPLACSGLHSGQSDCITWNTPNSTTVNFTDGAVMTVTLNNAEDWAITSTVTFDMTQGPTKVPEPASFTLFGAAMVGLGLARRRRGCAKIRGAL